MAIECEAGSDGGAHAGNPAIMNFSYHQSRTHCYVRAAPDSIESCMESYPTHFMTLLYRQFVKVIPYALVMSGGFFPSFLSAQTSPKRDSTHAKRDTVYAAHDTVTVYAERSYSAVSDAEFRASDFALRPRNSAQDILRVVPGLVIAQHAGGGKAEQIFLRGFDCDHGTDINISVDDAPVNMVSHGHGQGYADLHFVIPETIERVDVVKGPYFARYGDLTTAGAVTFSTADSLKENLIKLEGGPTANHGPIEAIRAVALLRAPITVPGINAYFGGEIYSSRGYFDNPQDFNRLNLFAKVRAGLGSNGSLTASVMSFSSGWNASGQIPERAVAQGLIDRFGSLDSTEGGATSRTTAIIRYASGGASPFTLTGSYTDYRFRLFSDFTYFRTDSVRGDEVEQTDSRSTLALRAENDILYEFAGLPMRTRIGANLRSDDIDVTLHHDSARVRLETIVDATIHERQIGPYAEQEVILPGAELLVGIRADYLSFDVENRVSEAAQPEGITQQLVVSPKANLSIPIGVTSALFINSGFGFHSNDARAVVQGGKTLPRAFGAETGFRYGGRNDVIQGSAALWMLDLESELVYSGDEGTTEESGRTRRQGIDLEIRATPFAWFTLGADATISRGRFRDLPEGENYIPLAPDLTVSANAVARFDALSCALRVRHVGDRPAVEDNSVRAQGYTIVDLSLSRRFDPVEVYANVENLFNVAWNEAQFDTESRLKGEAAPITELHFTPGTPLAVRLGVALRF